MGYGFGDAGQLRLKLEYFFRETVHNEASAIQSRGGVAVAKLDGEAVSADDRIGSVTSQPQPGHALYVGVGAGVGFTNVDYGGLWVRNSDPDLITSVVQSVTGLMPSSRHSSDTDVSRCVIAAWASRT